MEWLSFPLYHKYKLLNTGIFVDGEFKSYLQKSRPLGINIKYILMMLTVTVIIHSEWNDEFTLFTPTPICSEHQEQTICQVYTPEVLTFGHPAYYIFRLIKCHLNLKKIFFNNIHFPFISICLTWIVAMSPSRRIISPTNSWYPTLTNSYIADPDIFSAVTTRMIHFKKCQLRKK